MPAYVISDVEWLDADSIDQYRSLAAPSIAHYGGRYVVRSSVAEAVEGDWAPRLLVVVEFPSMDRAREWYSSPEYAEALKVRQNALRRRLIFVEGVA